MMQAKLSQAAMAAMIAARGTPAHRVTVKRLFKEAKQHYNIPDRQRLKAEVDDVNSRVYGVLIRKKTGQDYSVADSLVPVYVTAPLVPVTAPLVQVETNQHKFIKVPNIEAKAMLQAIAAGMGTPVKLKAAPAATWLDTFMLKNKLHVPVGKSIYALPLEDAMAALVIYGTEVQVPYSPDGMGGVLTDPQNLYIPVPA